MDRFETPHSSQVPSPLRRPLIWPAGFLAAAVLVVAGSASALPTRSGSAQNDDGTTLLVKFAPGSAPDERNAVLSAAGATKKRDLAAIGVSVVDVPGNGKARALSRLRLDK